MSDLGKVSIGAAGLRVLRDHAVQVGTLYEWSVVALEYAEAAERTLVNVLAEREEVDRAIDKLIEDRDAAMLRCEVTHE